MGPHDLIGNPGDLTPREEADAAERRRHRAVIDPGDWFAQLRDLEERQLGEPLPIPLGHIAIADHERVAVIAGGLYCPQDGGALQAYALLSQEPGTDPRLSAVLKLLCQECGWLGFPDEAVER